MWLLLCAAFAADVAWYEDFDADGYGDGGVFVVAPASAGPAGFVRNDLDCNDVNGQVSPGANEVCNGIDDDCDGFVDSAAACPLGNFSHYADHAYAVFNYDGGSIDTVYRRSWTNARLWCESANWNLVTIETSPEDVYILEQVRSENAARTYWIGLNDRDNEDTFVWSSGISSDYRNWSNRQPDDFFGEDCVTTNFAGSQWNDDECSDSRPFVCEADGDPRAWWPDSDNDGFGDAFVDAVFQNGQPSGYVANRADCDDDNAGVAPGTTELCNGLDDDCNGDIDDNAVDQIVAYTDSDLDGFGAGSSVRVCALGDGQSANADDCNDNDRSVSPNGTEVCNQQDDDCNGVADDNALDAAVWLIDSDGDGFGGMESLRACDQPDGTTTVAGDCDDAVGSTNPGADETCNEVDDNCNDEIDEDPVGGTTYFFDGDADGFGRSTGSVEACENPLGYVVESGDCDDENNTVYPDAPELMDGIDNDCDGFPEDPDPDTDTDPDSDPDTDPDSDPDTDPDSDPNPGERSSRQFDPGTADPLASGCSCSARGGTTSWGAFGALMFVLATVRRSRRG